MPDHRYKGVTMKEMEYDVQTQRTKSRLPWILLSIAIIIILILGVVIVLMAILPGGSEVKESNEASKLGGKAGGGAMKTDPSPSTIVIERVVPSTPSTTTSTISTTQPSTVTSTTTKTVPTFASHPGEPFNAEEEGSFIKVDNMRSIASAGELFQIHGVNDTASCMQACTVHDACYGIDYNKDVNECMVITDQNYELHEGEGFVNYRHLFLGQTSCAVHFLHFAGRKPLNRSEPLVQPTSVDTPDLCMESSMGKYSDREGPSSKSHIYAMFDRKEKQCNLYETYPDDESDPNWDLYRQDLRCHPPNQPDCMDTMFRFADKVPGSSLGVLYVQDLEIKTFIGCEEACYSFRRPVVSGGRAIGYAKAVGFMYNRITGDCSIAASANTSLLGKTDYIETPNIDFYVYAAYCGKCEDLFGDVSEGYISEGGTESYATTVDLCRDTCLERGSLYDPNSPKCYGFDFIPSQRSCRLNFEKNYKLTPMTESINYKRVTICQRFPACNKLPSYIPTVNTLPPRGMEVEPEGSAAESHTPLLRCAFSCQGNKYHYDRIKVDRKTCYGFAFNEYTDKCFLYYDFDYTLGDVGNDQGYVNYRRMYTCRDENYCSDTYKSSPGWHGVVTSSDSDSDEGSHRQPWDINTLERCKDRCWGYSIATPHTCHGLDFNYTSNRCTLFTTPDYTLELGSGNDHYRRNMLCQPTL